MVYYYPYANYLESRPSRFDLEREDVKIIRGAAKASSSSSAAADAEGGAGVSDSEEESSVLVGVHV